MAADAYEGPSSRYVKTMEAYIEEAPALFEAVGTEARLLSRLHEMDALLGEVVMQLRETAEKKATGTAAFAVAATIVTALLTITGLVVFSIVLIRSVNAPLTLLRGHVERIGEGDFSAEITADGHDEISQVLATLGRTVRNLRGILRGTRETAATVVSSSKELTEVSDAISSTAGEMQRQSTTAASATSQASTNVTGMAASAGQMSSAVSQVAAAIEQMSSSLNEVARNCQKESRIASEADRQTVDARRRMGRLDEAAVEITKVIDIINDIADQTNLLALNATIEAASAGEAGRAFAVVAQEVKDLARQTAQATDQVGAQVVGMQEVVGDSVRAMESISQIISEVSTISQTIVSAVEQQSATVNEIASNVGGANTAAAEIAGGVRNTASDLSEVTDSVQSLDQGVAATTERVRTIHTQMQQLRAKADELNTLVERFRV